MSAKLSSNLVLCVDDDSDDRTLICEFIADEFPSIKVDECQNGMDALHYLQGARDRGLLPGLIILDMNMPKLDGIQTVQRIKSEPDYAKIPVVIFTTSSSRLDHLLSSWNNVQFVIKPNNYKTFRSEVRKMLTPFFTQINSNLSDQ